jgi:CubicO group peptidase (beta-lactamase class C family)
VFVGGFGLADKKRKLPARPDTVYRAGSISKLFTAVSVMQLVEQGRISLDAPVTNYLPNFRVISPFDNASPITLRQLMCHRSGMVRESPVGSYFDDSEPGIDKTISSLASCVLVYPPGTRTKYSNSGVTIEGAAVQRVVGIPFERHLQQKILAPLGMTNSAFLRTPNIRRKLSTAYMNVANVGGGFHEIEAPVFEFGILPAGNLYTTAEDLAQFLKFIFAEGRAGGQQLLRAETLPQMFTPQLTTDTNGFGLGFGVNHFRGRKTVSHTGAVYGFSSSIVAVPGDKVGVVILNNNDITTGPVRKLNAKALTLMLAAKTAQAPTNAPSGLASNSWNNAQLQAFTGDYESQSYWARIDLKGDKLLLNLSAQQLTLTQTAAWRFEANGRVAYNAPVVFERDDAGNISTFTALEQKFRRVNPANIAETPASWIPLLGSYGPAFIPLIISVKHSHLYAMTENEFDYRLTPLNSSVFQMPPGLYEGEQIVFQTDRSGKIHTALLANMPLRRRSK